MITSWADEEDKANAKYDAIRGKSKQNTSGGSSNNGNQGGRNNNNYSGPNRKRKPDNTVAAIQCPAKENSKKTSGGFKDLLKGKCPWHLDGNTPPSSATNSGEHSRVPRSHHTPMTRKARRSTTTATATSRYSTRRSTSSSADYLADWNKRLPVEKS
jgi:hypothetical protein